MVGGKRNEGMEGGGGKENVTEVKMEGELKKWQSGEEGSERWSRKGKWVGRGLKEFKAVRATGES